MHIGMRFLQKVRVDGQAGQPGYRDLHRQLSSHSGSQASGTSPDKAISLELHSLAAGQHSSARTSSWLFRPLPHSLVVLCLIRSPVINISISYEH